MNEDPYLRLAARHKAETYKTVLSALETLHDRDGGLTEDSYQFLIRQIKDEIAKWKEVSE